ncbi:hypothetical protein HJ590_17230 [Naumannella sp. ID2617S]|nr:hypothetical protein [Naumannella sp. ID2617S]
MSTRADPVEEGDGLDREPSARARHGLGRGIAPGPLEWGLIAAACLLTALAALAGLRKRPINADDGGLQNLLLAWAAGEPRGAHVGSDNFVLHFPLYWLTSPIANPWWQLAVQAVLCNLVVLLGMVAMLRHLARFSARTPWPRLLVGYAPVLVWAGLALVPFSAGDPVVRDYFRFISHLNINLRHLEAGVWPLLLVALGFGLRRFLRRARLMELQLGLITMLSVLALTLTPNGISPVNHRYLYLGVVSLVPLAGFMLVLRLRKVPRVTGLVTVALLAAVLLNGAASVGGLRGARTGDESTRRIVRAVSAAGVDKGYANYWSANQITWSSRRAAVPLVCEHIDGSTPRLARYDWLINRADLDRPATRPSWSWKPSATTGGTTWAASAEPGSRRPIRWCGSTGGPRSASTTPTSGPDCRCPDWVIESGRVK